jgi:hypothetical protein
MEKKPFLLHFWSEQAAINERERWNFRLVYANSKEDAIHKIYTLYSDAKSVLNLTLDS